MKNIIVALASVGLIGCATLTEDAMTPIAMSFSDGSTGKCELTNKRGAWTANLPGTMPVRKSDDALKYTCQTTDGRRAVGSIRSEMGAKIIASAVFLDFGITDAITDKHRKYAESFVIPIEPKAGGQTQGVATSQDEPSGTANDAVYKDLEAANDLHARGILTDAEYEAEKKRILERK